MEKCVSYTTAEKFDYKNLLNYLEQKYKVIKYKNVALIQFKIGFCCIFNYWAIVCWWLSYDESKKLLDEVKEYEINSYKEILSEEFYWEENKNITIKIKDDVISLKWDEIEEKIAISHWLAQSIKLNYFEWAIEKTIQLTKNIPIDLSKKWNIKLSKTKVSKMRWELFLAKSSVNLHYELLDEPEFIWEYPEFWEFYRSTSNYLEIKSRIEVLNKRIYVLDELFDMLSDEQNYKHSTMLEWIVIWLIATEIFFTVFHSILKWF